MATDSPLSGAGNGAISSGEINLAGVEADGMEATGSGHTLTNTGTITTNPPPAANHDSDGVVVEGTTTRSSPRT